MYLCWKRLRSSYIDHVHFSDSIRWASGQEAPLTSKGAVGSIASSAMPELHKAAPSPPTELMVQTSPPHPRNPWPPIPRPNGKEPLISGAACSHFRERCSLCSTGLVQSQATSQAVFEKVSGGVPPKLYQDVFFFLTVQCLRLGTEPSEGNGAPLTICFVVPIILLIV